MNNNEEKNTNSKINNIIITVCGILLLLGIILLITISFIKSKYAFEITAPIITLIAFLLVIFLSKYFDDFQIGKIISLKRNVTEYREKNEKLESDKNELIKQIINFNIQSQHTANVNYNGIPLEILQNSISVQKADDEEVQEEKSQENSEIPKEEKTVNRRINRAKMEEYVIRKYFREINYDSFLQNVKVDNKFGDTDPISNRNIIFDAYYNDNEKERFIEVTQSSPLIIFDRIYVMLNKIYNYNHIRNAKASLTLIIPKIAEEDTKINSINKLRDIFSPAITSGLLNIVQIDISKEEMEELYKK